MNQKEEYNIKRIITEGQDPAEEDDLAEMNWFLQLLYLLGMVLILPFYLLVFAIRQLKK